MRPLKEFLGIRPADEEDPNLAAELKRKRLEDLDAQRRWERFEGLRSKMRGLTARSRPADPARVRHRCRNWSDPRPLQQRQREKANWKRSKRGRAEMRRRRRARKRPALKTGEQIRRELAELKVQQERRRAARSLVKAGFTIVAEAGPPLKV